MGFAGDLELWFLCGAVLSLSTIGDPPVFTLGGLCVLWCVFSSCLGVGSLSLLLLTPFGLSRGGFVGVDSVLMTGLNHVKHLGALSGPLFPTLVYGSISHHFIYFY